MKRLKVLGVVGSPRKYGATNYLVEAALEGAGQQGEKIEDVEVETEKLFLYDFELENCTGCDACLRPPNECPLDQKDDGPKLWEALKGADAILVGAPSYFHGVPGLVKTLIDRSRPLKMAKHALSDKVFAPLSASGLRHSGAETVQSYLVEYAITQGMVVVGAVGHPVIEGNLPVATTQKDAMKEFRTNDERDSIATTIAGHLGARVVGVAARLKPE
ncbi:MAG: flavodoxin family protein [Promethearchaeota archaeon]